MVPITGGVLVDPMGVRAPAASPPRPYRTALGVVKVARTWQEAPMSTVRAPTTSHPLVILPEVMLPGSATEVGLEPEEATFLARLAGERTSFPVAVACRPAGYVALTQLGAPAHGPQGPGPLIEAALLGEAVILEPDEEEPTPRLALEPTARTRLAGVEETPGGWLARTAPWPYARAEQLDADAVLASTRRFYRALVVTRGEDEAGLQEALEGPITELEAAGSPLRRLLLMADYLYERADVRQLILVADGADEVQGLVEDALELLERGTPPGKGAVRGPLRAYFAASARDGLGSLTRPAAVLRALAPLLDPGDRVLAEVDALAHDLEALDQRFDRLTTRLLRDRRSTRS